MSYDALEMMERDTVLNIVEDYIYLGESLKSNLNKRFDMELFVNSFNNVLAFYLGNLTRLMLLHFINYFFLTVPLFMEH